MKVAISFVAVLAMMCNIAHGNARLLYYGNKHLSFFAENTTPQDTQRVGWHDTIRELSKSTWTLLADRKADVVNYKQRKWLVGGSLLAIWGASFYTLHEAWYRKYQQSGFHFFNDFSEWQQVDKAGHLWTAYQMSRISGMAWRWAGFNQHQAAWWGGVSGLAYQSIIEIQDGLSAEWGFSVGDMIANIAGSGLFVVQELIGGDQKIQLKLSYSPYSYSTDLKKRREAIFGKTLSERLLKDYNSQTYWLSANIRAFMPACGLPKWLNFSVGYSGKGMLGATHNVWTDQEGVGHNRSDIVRTRHFYVSADVDLTKIKTNNKLLRSLFYLLNMVKLPAPTIEFSKGKVFGHWIYF